MAFDWLKSKWRELEHGTPGRRFQDRYEHNKERQSHRPAYRRFLKGGLGILLTLAGLAMLVMPGPAFLVIPLGLGLLADQARWLARLLDRAEVNLRRLLAAIKRWWRHAPALVRVSAVGLAVMATAGAGFLLYKLVLA
jgi:hypothetical protein